jgi:amino acid transporter
MTQSLKLSLFSALLISLNIMLGSGIFINTVLLAKTVSGLGALTYLIVGFLLLPLIISFSRLMRHHQGGTFYDFGAFISPFAGFISSWSYFTAKMAAFTLGIHIFVSLTQTMIPLLQGISTLLLDSIIIILFALLNMLDVRIGRSIQYSFIVLKMIPISFAILSGIALFQGTHFTTQTLPWQNLPATFPFVLYAFTGFEAICSLGKLLANPEHDGPKAILLSYGLGVLLVVFYQFFFFGALGDALGNLSSYLGAFPALLHSLFPQGYPHTLLIMLHAGIASSSLGSAYSIMYSNAWNLFALAQEGHVYAQKWLITVNQHTMPYVCIVVESLVALCYLAFSQGKQIPLQQICSLGMTITYSLSVLSLVFISQRSQRQRIVPLFALGSCSILLGSVVNNMLTFGMMPYLFFLSILLLGSLMFWHNNKHISAI